MGHKIYLLRSPGVYVWWVALSLEGAPPSTDYFNSNMVLRYTFAQEYTGSREVSEHNSWEGVPEKMTPKLSIEG